MSQDGLEALKFTSVSEQSPMPLYHQIYLILREKIYDETFPYESTVPSETHLCKIFGVSRITAKRALDELAGAGLVNRRRGAGTRVTYRAPGRPVRTSVEGLLQNLTEMGLKTELNLLEFGYVSATPDVARALNCEPGTTVQKTVRVRRLADEPFSYLTTFVPQKIGHAFSERDFATTPMLTLLERSGVAIISAEQTLTAVPADAAAAAALDVDIGSPLLQISRTVLGQDQCPVEYIIGLYRPDRYQFRMKLDRIGDEDRTKVWSYQFDPHQDLDQGHEPNSEDEGRVANAARRGQ